MPHAPAPAAPARPRPAPWLPGPADGVWAVALGDLGALALFADQPQDRLPVVGPDPPQRVDPIQLLQRRLALVAVVAEQLADHRPVLLLHVGWSFFQYGRLRVNLIRSRWQYWTSWAFRELAAVVRVDPQQRERQPPADLFQPREHRRLAFAPDPDALGPGGPRRWPPGYSDSGRLDRSRNAPPGRPRRSPAAGLPRA